MSNIKPLHLIRSSGDYTSVAPVGSQLFRGTNEQAAGVYFRDNGRDPHADNVPDVHALDLDRDHLTNLNRHTHVEPRKPLSETDRLVSILALNEMVTA